MANPPQELSSLEDTLVRNAVSDRTFEPITTQDLLRLVEIAQLDFESLFKRKPSTCGRFRGRLAMLALCQGAALHYVDGKRGVKDLDVWGFFRELPDITFPPRRCSKRDFGASHLGRHPNDLGYVGRRVDVLGRSISFAPGENAVDAVRRYLASGATETARRLAERPVVAIDPEDLFAKVVWPC
jgi:hypothetical protein